MSDPGCWERGGLWRPRGCSLVNVSREEVIKRLPMRPRKRRCCHGPRPPRDMDQNWEAKWVMLDVGSGRSGNWGTVLDPCLLRGLHGSPFVLGRCVTRPCAWSPVLFVCCVMTFPVCGPAWFCHSFVLHVITWALSPHGLLLCPFTVGFQFFLSFPNTTKTQTPKKTTNENLAPLTLVWMGFLCW